VGGADGNSETLLLPDRCAATVVPTPQR
jgi:hypothetical protein